MEEPFAQGLTLRYHGLGKGVFPVQDDVAPLPPDAVEARAFQGFNALAA